MKTTIDIPDDLLHRAKVAAAQQRTTLRELVTKGLDRALRPREDEGDRRTALARLERGLRLRGQPLSREESHGRDPLP